MALIKCPECGRENVSDSAEACPGCGYGIKAHFESFKLQGYTHTSEEVRTEEQQRIESLKLAKKLREERDEEIKQREKKFLDSIKMPKKPSFIKTSIIVGIALSPFILLCLFLSIKTKDTVMTFCFWFSLIICFVAAFPGYNENVEEYKLAQQDFETYKRKKLKEQKEKEQKREQEQNKKYNSYRQTVILQCPLCYSTNVVRISAVSRTMSVSAFGLASDKIGKQYQCKNCKHMW